MFKVEYIGLKLIYINFLYKILDIIALNVV